ncbi:endo-chitosanase [Aspergillus lentulus]|nr:endo-chitosanase [Aspergillus lentulus]
MRYLATATVLAGAGLASAYSVPANLQQIYNKHKSGTCQNKLQDGFSDGISGSGSFAYCGDIQGAIFLHSSANGGQYDNMDIDCDGANNSAGDCANDPSGQSMTAFMDTVKQYGISDLDANIHPYVVFGNSGSSPTFDPQQYGMEPLSVMAVVCNNQLFYGVWGDTNGGTSTGEASISLAKLCFPNDGITGDNGHGEEDVLYIGFIGQDAVPGASAAWTARDTQTFEESIKSLGDRLVAKLSA